MRQKRRGNKPGGIRRPHDWWLQSQKPPAITPGEKQSQLIKSDVGAANWPFGGPSTISKEIRCLEKRGKGLSGGGKHPHPHTCKHRRDIELGSGARETFALTLIPREKRSGNEDQTGRSCTRSGRIQGRGVERTRIKYSHQPYNSPL